MICLMNFRRLSAYSQAVVPYGIRLFLNWAKKEYGNIPMWITENGYSDRAGNLDDFGRLYYYKHYINNVMKG
jgi:lactase-phlorizin hydrolase